MKKSDRWMWLLLIFLVTAGSVVAMDCDEAIRRYVYKTYQLDTAAYRIEVLSSQLRTSDVAPADLLVTPLSQKEPLGLFSLQVAVTKNGARVESGQVSLRIRKYAEVLVATDHLQRHDTPAPDKFTTQRVDVTTLQEQPVTAYETIANLRMKRNLPKGQVLTTGALEPVPAIEIGRQVTIVCATGALSVTTEGTAQQAGSIGDLVRVRNKATGKVLVAKVLDENRVAIQP